MPPLGDIIVPSTIKVVNVVKHAETTSITYSQKFTIFEGKCVLVVSACLSTFTTLMADGTIMSPSGGVQY